MPKLSGVKQRLGLRGGMTWGKSHRGADDAAVVAAAAPLLVGGCAEPAGPRQPEGQQPELAGPCCTPVAEGECGGGPVASGGAVGLSHIVGGFLRWQKPSQEAVAASWERIDRMWLDELMLSCDSELFSRIRELAAEVEGGADPGEAVHRAAAAAEEIESIALTSLEVRLDARVGVAMEGGAEAMEKQIRQLRQRATLSVMPHIMRLSDPCQAADVKRSMALQLRDAQEEFASINAMKTAKAEAMLELQDEASEREWVGRQLGAAVELLEACPLSADVAPRELEHFFVQTIGHCLPDDALRGRAVHCLEVLKLWGEAAAAALADLPEGRARAAIAVTPCEEEAVSKRASGHEEEAVSKRASGHLDKTTRPGSLEASP